MKYNRLLSLCALGFALTCSSANAQQMTPSATPASPPSAPAETSASNLEKLVAPIALYSDPLIATILPAAVYPLEIVQAARFVKDTNNLAKLDDQPWDENVRAVARIPAVIEKMDTELSWTTDLGQAFLDQPQQVMDTIQALRAKAQALGTLKTSPEQIVVVTNVVVIQTNVTQVVTVTNQIVQVYSSNPQVVYVPVYDPWYVYYPPPVYYVGPPPVVTFAVGVTVGLIIANNCDWHHGGIYVGHHGVAVWGGGSYHGHGNVNIKREVNFNGDININTGNQKWQPDQSRLRTSGAPGAKASARSAEARGWSGGATQPAVASRATSGAASARPSSSPNVARPTPNQSNNRPSASPSNLQSNSGASRESAFGGVRNGSNSRDFSDRGSVSRGGGGRSFGGGRR